MRNQQMTMQKNILGVKNAKGEQKYYATFGQYVLTPEVYEELESEITRGERISEVLTDAV